jgi:toxin ParE1/3/4
VKLKPVVLREVAARDVEDALSYYVGEGGRSLGLAFIDALEAAIQHVAAHPQSGSPRYAIELDLPDLRCWNLKRFSYLIFYVDGEDEVDVWRVLHGQRDIPEWLKARPGS